MKELEVKIQEWLNSKVVSEQDKQEILKLKETNLKELEEAFAGNLEFGTGGLRGIMGIGTNRMNIYTVAMATQGLVNYLKKQFPDKNLSVVVARDSRNNSNLFEKVAASVLSANDIKTFIFNDITPTPVLSFAVRELKCNAGIMITASHNPKEYNGYKVYWEDGAQLVNPHDVNVINEVKAINNLDNVNFTEKKELITYVSDSVLQNYYQNLKSIRLNTEIIEKYSDLKIVYTPLHGTGYKILPEAIKLYGFKNIIETPPQNVPDGNFSSVISPNPEEKEGMKLAIEKAIETNADLILATDPDADRLGVGFRNNNGEYELLNGNQTATLITYYLLKTLSERNQLKGNEMIIKTIVTTDLLSDIAKKYNVACFDVLTGFKYIADIIRKYEGKLKFICGGEESYGFLIGDFIRDKDGIMTACMIAEITAWAKNQNKTLADLLIDISYEFGLYLEKQVSITKKGLEGMNEIKQMMDNFRKNHPESLASHKIIKIADYQNSTLIDKINNLTTQIEQPKSNVIQYFLDDGSKVTIRPSGTEPKIKFYFSVKANIDRNQDYNQVLKQLEDYIQKLKIEIGLN